jgi:hypothetical protein
MKTRSIITFLSLISLTFPASADTFILKDGTQLEGTVLREEGGSYVIEVQVTKTIKDERVIAKTDVKEIKRARPDEPAFEAIQKLVPTPDALTSDEYSARIRAVEKFRKDFPASPKLRDAEAILKTLKDEANEVLSGSIKLNGKIVPASEYQANEYDFEARVQAAKIRDLIKENKTLQALRAFAAMQRDFKNTNAFHELVPQMIRVIRAYQSELQNQLATYESRIKERTVGLERMSAEDRRISEQAIKEQDAAFQARFKAEKAARVEWLATNPYFKPSLDDASRFASQELSKLGSLPSAPTVDAGKAYREAYASIQSGGDSSTVSGAINKVKSAQVAPRYVEKLESMAKSR